MILQIVLCPAKNSKFTKANGMPGDTLREPNLDGYEEMELIILFLYKYSNQTLKILACNARNKGYMFGEVCEMQ